MSKKTIENILQSTNGGLDYYKMVLPRLIIKGNKSLNTLNPFYNDTKPSLSIYKHNDRWLFKDFGDPKYHGDVIDFAAFRYGLDIKRDLQEILTKIADELNIPTSVALEDNQPSQTSSTIIFNENFSESELNFWLKYGVDAPILEEYSVKPVKSFSTRNATYTARPDQLIFAYTGDFGTKIYMPGHGNKPSKFIWHTKLEDVYVYGLKQLPEKGDVVYITGGEKDVLTFAGLGYPAISLNSETAIMPDNLAEKLRDKFTEVIVCYDLDDTGTKTSVDLCSKHGFRRMILPKFLLESGKDISDFVASGHTLANPEILYLSADCPFSPEEIKAFRKDHQVIGGRMLYDQGADEIPMLVAPIIKRTGLIALGGTSDAGKSSLLRQLAISIASNKDNFLEFHIESNNRKVIYVSSEDDEESIGTLLRKQNKELNVQLEDLDNIRFIFQTSDILSTLDQELSIEPACLIIVDAFADFYSGKMNETNCVRTFLNDFQDLSKKHDCLFIILHHTGKRTDQKPPSMDHLLGSQGFEAKMRMVMELRPDQYDHGLKHLCIVKGNYLPEEYKHESFVLRFDENLVFHRTDDRVSFSDLVSNNDNRPSYEDSIDEIIRLRDIGKSHKTISTELGVSSTTIGRWIKQHDKK